MPSLPVGKVRSAVSDPRGEHSRRLEREEHGERHGGHPRDLGAEQGEGRAGRVEVAAEEEAAAAPKPDAAPVINAIFPSSRDIFFSQTVVIPKTRQR